VYPGVAATLDGSASTDPESAPSTYMWKIDSGPQAAPHTLMIRQGKASIHARQKGRVRMQSGGQQQRVRQRIDYVTIVVYNNPPVARAGDNVTIR
jgi:hypothetical protein